MAPIRMFALMAAACAAPFVHCSQAESPLSAAKLVASPKVLVIAHRGASAHAPENTLPAFRLALEAKADLVELDYHHSFDGVPIVIHDQDVDRTTNGRQVFGRNKQLVADTPMADLKRLDAGSWFGAGFSRTPLSTLEEAVEVIQSGSMTLIEHKAGDAKTCVDFLKRSQLIDDVVVQSFDWDFLKQCHQLAPNLTLGALGSKELTETKLEVIAQTGASVVGWNHKHLTGADIDAIHNRQWKAWAYTVNNMEAAEKLVKLGIDGVITDRPLEMKKWLESEK